jgi:hypothetical protein
MAAISTPTLPTQSEIRAWNVEPLLEHAAGVRAFADSCDEAAATVARELKFPGGTVWEGCAAEAAEEYGRRDRALVSDLTAHYRHIAMIEEAGANDQGIAAWNAVNALDAAVADGFTVGEDLSVSYPAGSSGPVQAAAWLHAVAIREAAEALAVADQEVGAQITTVVGCVSLSWPRVGGLKWLHLCGGGVSL